MSAVLLLLISPPGGLAWSARAIDLGRGLGSLTAELPELVGANEVLGTDNSPAMLEAAEKYRRPGVSFAPGDLASWQDPGAWDLVFSNAALQWTGDHEAVLRRWKEAPAAGRPAGSADAEKCRPSGPSPGRRAGPRGALPLGLRRRPAARLGRDRTCSLPRPTPPSSTASASPSSGRGSRFTCTSWSPPRRSSNG